ncbi:MAG: hypothetical protein AB7F25_13585 [Deferribacterales bacterium]
MITIAGITLPETAVWTNETAYGLPQTGTETDLSGAEIVYAGKPYNSIEIYIPATESGMKREDVLSLCRVASAAAAVHADINGRQMEVVFVSDSSAVQLKPLNARQVQSDADVYSGTIRLSEV